MADSGAQRVCFVCIDNVVRAPYVRRYVKLAQCPYDFIYWDRNGTNDDIGADLTFRYRRAVDDSAPKLQRVHDKLLGYVGFRRYATRMLRERDYSCVVALTGNCAVMIADVLLQKYPGRYVVDIRDYWREDFVPYHELEQRLIRSSGHTVISSPAYEQFLCEHDYLLMHNSQRIDESVRSSFRGPHMLPLTIACVGTAKNLEYDRKVLAYFANDDRFELKFIGRGYGALQACRDELGARNVVVEDAFCMSQTMEKYAGADLVLNMYGNHSPYWDYALSNKLYFAAQLGLPILVCPDTEMARMAQEYDLGLAVDLDDPGCKDAICHLFDDDACECRAAGIEAFMARVESDNARTDAALAQLLNG